MLQNHIRCIAFTWNKICHNSYINLPLSSKAICRIFSSSRKKLRKFSFPLNSYKISCKRLTRIENRRGWNSSRRTFGMWDSRKKIWIIIYLLTKRLWNNHLVMSVNAGHVWMREIGRPRYPKGRTKGKAYLNDFFRNFDFEILNQEAIQFMWLWTTH